MTIKTFTIVGVVISTMLIVTFPRVAAAAEIDELLVYPGVNCHVVGGGPASYNTSGWLINNTSSIMTVECPMYDNGYDFTGTMWVYDNSVSADVSCDSRARNPGGSPNVNSPTLTTSGNQSFPPAKALNFTGPDVGGTWTYRFYRCTLPPTTAIVSYRGCAIHLGGTCSPK
jgi:hypothetical protein